MNPVDEHHRKYCGSKILYDKFRNRRPVFLQRNLRKVLDHHEHNLNLLKNRSTNATLELAATDMLSNNQHPRCLPSMDLLSTATKPTTRTLEVHPTSIMKKRWNSDGGRMKPLLLKPVAKPVPSADPMWLPAPNHVQMQCNVHCHIHSYDAENEKLGPLLHTDSHLANLIRIEDAKGEMDFSIETEPFIVKENQMLTNQLANPITNSGRRWKTTRQPQIVLSLFIDCFNSEDASQLLSVIDPDSTLETPLSPARAQLRAHWKRLSACPSTYSALRRYRHELKDQPTRADIKELDYLLRADISWDPVTKLSGTPLAICNHVMQMSEPKTQIRLPRTTRHPQTCRITYIFDGGPIGSRSLMNTELSCVFCPDRLLHPTFDRLHFHYLSFHDHFTFRVHKPAAASPDSVTRTVLVELAVPKPERASDNVCDEREMAWIKPKTPFDLQQYLLEGGYNAWASGKRLPLKTFPKTAKPSSMLKGVARTKDLPTNGQSTLMPSDRQPRAEPPGAVKEIPSRKRKRYRVPNIPGVNIFRAESKREVKPGEELSESDAEPDDSWLQTKHRVEDCPQLTGAAREFAVLFDGHLLQDEPRNLANVHISGAVVRFVRKLAVQLRQPRLRQELKLKLDELMEMNLISEEYVVYCLALTVEGEQEHINGGPAIKEEFPSRLNHTLPSADVPSHNRLDVIMIDDSDSEPGAEVSPATFPHTNYNEVDMQDAVYNAPNVCLCGKVALGSYKIITCRNTVSSTHLDYIMNESFNDN